MLLQLLYNLYNSNNEYIYNLYEFTIIVTII